jgi:hypothetical protein
MGRGGLVRVKHLFVGREGEGVEGFNRDLGCRVPF